MPEGVEQAILSIVDAVMVKLAAAIVFWSDPGPFAVAGPGKQELVVWFV